MNTVFFGTADFGLPTLEALRAHKHHSLIAAVTGPDKPRGRGQAQTPTPVGEWLSRQGIQPVFKPVTLSDPDFAASLRALHADAFIVVAFRILPEAVYTIPPFAFNMHASLLPAYRGAAPVQRAIMAGETRTGVTTFLLKKSVDTGDIIAQREAEIGPEDTAGVMFERLSKLGAKLVIDTLDQLESGQVALIPQDPKSTSKAPKISDADLWIDFRRHSRDLVNQVRALSPHPGVSALFRGSNVKFFALSRLDSPSLGAKPGAIVGAGPRDGLLVSTGDGVVRIETIQPAGKRRQSGAEFVRGYHVALNEKFEIPETDHGPGH